MAVVTGATSGLGNGSGIDPNGGVDGKCSVSYRGEENLWGNIWTWLDKVNILAKGQNEVFVHEIGATVADDTTTGYKSLGYHWSIVTVIKVPLVLIQSVQSYLSLQRLVDRMYSQVTLYGRITPTTVS